MKGFVSSQDLDKSCLLGSLCDLEPLPAKRAALGSQVTRPLLFMRWSRNTPSPCSPQGQGPWFPGSRQPPRCCVTLSKLPCFSRPSFEK